MVITWEIVVLDLGDSGNKIGENSLPCFLPTKRKNWLSLFVIMRLAMFLLMSHILRFSGPVFCSKTSGSILDRIQEGDLYFVGSIVALLCEAR